MRNSATVTSLKTFYLLQALHSPEGLYDRLKHFEGYKVTISLYYTIAYAVSM
jgi:hypothetical protein